MLRNEAMEEYGKAQKLGQKDYQDAPRQSVCRCALDDILQNVQVETSCPWAWSKSRMLVVGTKTGRQAAPPLLPAILCPCWI